jgi:hypothetical protein
MYLRLHSEGYGILLVGVVQLADVRIVVMGSLKISKKLLADILARW